MLWCGVVYVGLGKGGIKKKMENYLETRELPYSKYINWPSCDSEDWMWRYWGNNYNTLLHIKVSPRHLSGLVR